VGPGVRRPVLLVACVTAAVLETVLVWLWAPTSTLGLSTQLSAPPPFDVFHDLRWIVVYQESWFGLALELAAFVALRAALTTVLVRAAWPAGVPQEPLAVTIRRSVVFVIVMALLLTPWVGLMFALAVVSLSWLFFVAVPVVLLLGVFVYGGVATGSWWRRTISARGAGWVVVGFIALTFFGSVMTTCPPVARLPIAAIAGVVNAWLWVRIVASVLQPRRASRAVPVAPIGVVAVFALVIGGTVAGFELSKTSLVHLSDPAVAATADWNPTSAARRVATPLMVVTGFNTQWDGVAKQFVQLAVPQRRFSYRGTSGGIPLSYGRDDTHRSLRALARELARQVEGFHRETGSQVTIVAESEGSLLAKTYLAAVPHAPVRNLVVLSPLVAPGRVYYPRSGGEGWGALGGLELEGLAWALGGLSPVDVTPDTPFLRSIVDDAPAFRGLVSCGLPGIRQLAVLPLDTGVSAPAPNTLAIPFTVVPGFHGGMLDDARTAHVVERVLAGRDVPDGAGWSVAEDVIQAGSSAWQVPQLPADVNDAWSDAPNPGNCRAVRAHLRAWLN
jgi:hypothetical protein